MNLAKLESVKAALRLVVAHGDNLHLENKINRYEEFEFSNFSTSDYIAQACNLGAPMAKALLVAIEGYEIHHFGALKIWPEMNPTPVQKYLEEFLNQFPDDI